MPAASRAQEEEAVMTVGEELAAAFRKTAAAWVEFARVTKQAFCEHRDEYGSTIVFVQDKPEDGVCLLCDRYFPAEPAEPSRG